MHFLRQFSVEASFVIEPLFVCEMCARNHPENFYRCFPPEVGGKRNFIDGGMRPCPMLLNFSNAATLILGARATR